MRIFSSGFFKKKICIDHDGGLVTLHVGVWAKTMSTLAGVLELCGLDFSFILCAGENSTTF